MSLKKPRASVTGIYGYIPEYVLTNAELEAIVNTSDEWIVSRTGIRERHILKDKDKAAAFMGISAARGLLQKVKVDPLDIDLLICATITPDFSTPATANIISHAIGAYNAFGYDLQAACSGFLYALVTGAQFIETNRCKKVIIVGTDKMSSVVNYKDRNTCVLFGDGAGAVLLEADYSGSGIVDSILKTDGSGEQQLLQKAGGSRNPASFDSVAAGDHFIYQNGRFVFKIAVSKMTEVIREIMIKNNLSTDSVDFIVPHQANARILSLVAQELGISMDKMLMNIENLGNTTAATIPLCLWQYQDKFKKNDRILLTAFGGGFTWGAVYIIW